MEIETIRDSLKLNLSGKRYQHILGVAETARKLGEHYHEDPEKLYLAGILHDAAKYMLPSQLIEFCKTHQIQLSEDDLMAHGIIHAKAGAFIAATVYQVTDPDILEAISCHSTGKKGMNRFQKILFAADYLDPNRGYEEISVLTDLAYANFESAVLEILKIKIQYVMTRSQYLHPNSIGFYNEQIGLAAI